MKFTPTLLALSLFSAAQWAVAQTDKPDALVQQVLDKHFPANAKALALFNENRSEAADKLQACHLARDTDGSDANQEQGDDAGGGFCMRFVSEKTVNTADGKRRYLYFTGDADVVGHAVPGLDSLFVFESKDGKDWSLRAHQETTSNTGWGQGNDKVQWTEFGQGLWGVMAEGGFVNMGASEGSHLLLFDDGTTVRTAMIATGSSTAGAIDCDDTEMLKAAEQSKAECLAERIDLNATVAVRKDLPAVSNLYPLEVTLNGHEGLKLVKDGKKAETAPLKAYKDQKFVFPYDSGKHTYVAPADYPKALGSWSE